MDVIRGFAHKLQRQNLARSQEPLASTFDHEYDFPQLRGRLEAYIDRKRIPPRQNIVTFTSTTNWTGLLFLEEKDFIGGGSFGDVFFGKWKKVPNMILPVVVIKVIRASPVNSRQAETRSRQVQREITVWHRLHHPNIVPFIGIAFTRGDYPSLISLWMPNGTIRQYLSDNPGIPRMGLIRGVGSGLAYLHAFQPPITHGDLKGDNVLVNKDGVPCLVDFGLSRMMEDQTLWATSATTAPGTTRWKAPELMCGDQPTVTMESDVYAFGMTCVEIVTNTSPFPLYRNDAAIITAVIIRGERPTRPTVADVDDAMWNLWTTCWDFDPSVRPSMLSVMSKLDSQDLPPAGTVHMCVVPFGPHDRIQGPVVVHTPSNGNVQSVIPPSSAAFQNPVTADDGKLVVSLDFGTTMSGIAYGSFRIANGKVQQILNWPCSYERHRKIPTCLLYDEHGKLMAWGMEAKNAGPVPGTIRCEWFKSYLEPSVLRGESTIDPRLLPLPPGKQAVDLIIDFLSHLWEYAKEQIARSFGAVADLDAADIWLTVPAVWDEAGRELMRVAAIAAGLAQSAQTRDLYRRERLRIMTEPEAATVHCAYLPELHKLKNNQNFMICDAGGGTVDLAVYKVFGNLAQLEIAEVCATSGTNCGSIFLDLRFRELVRTILADHPHHLDPASIANFMHIFSETEKLDYAGEIDDNQMFSFTCFNPKDPHDPSVGLMNGELVIPGSILRREVFDPVVNQVLALIEAQAANVSEPIDALLLVGGFSGNSYLFDRVDEQFKDRIKVISRPSDVDTATLRGATQYGLPRRPLVSCRPLVSSHPLVSSRPPAPSRPLVSSVIASHYYGTPGLECLITPFVYNRDEPIPDPPPGSKRAIMKRQQLGSSWRREECVPGHTSWEDSESLFAWADSVSPLGLPEYEAVDGNSEAARLPPYSPVSTY